MNATEVTKRPFSLPVSEHRDLKRIAGAAGVSASRVIRAAIQEIGVRRLDGPDARKLRPIYDALDREGPVAQTSATFPKRELGQLNFAAERIGFGCTQADAVRVGLIYVAGKLSADELRKRALALPPDPTNGIRP